MFVGKQNSSKLTDEELIKQYRKSKDLELLGQVYERYMTYVYGVCLKYLHNAETSKDAVMAIFESLIVKVQKHEIDNFKSWLYVVSKNHCLGQIRKHKKTLTVAFDGEVMHYMENIHHDNTFDFVGEHHELKACMENLPEQQRATVNLFYMEGKSYNEISEKLGVTKNKVRSYIQNGRRNLKICLEKNNVKRS